jgi:hypothetical protein
MKEARVLRRRRRFVSRPRAVDRPWLARLPRAASRHRRVRIVQRAEQRMLRRRIGRRRRYTHALLWVLGGNRASAAKSVEIIDAWSATSACLDLRNSLLRTTYDHKIGGRQNASTAGFRLIRAA